MEILLKFLGDHWKWVIATLIALPGGLLAYKRLFKNGEKSGHSPTQNTSGSGNNPVQIGDGAQVGGYVVGQQTVHNHGGAIIDVNKLIEQFIEQQKSHAKEIHEKDKQLANSEEEKRQLTKTREVLRVERARAKDENRAREIDQAIAAISKGNPKEAENFFEGVFKREQVLGKEADERASQAAVHVATLARYHNIKKALFYAGKATELDPGNAAAWNLLGIIYVIRGDLEKAEEYSRKALEIFEALGSKEGIAAAYNNLGVIYNTRNDLDQAEAMYRRALEINETLGSKEGMAQVYTNLGNIYLTREELEEAEDHYREALKLHEKLGSKEGMAVVFANLGSIYGIRNDLKRAEDNYRKALEFNEDLDNKEGMAVVSVNLGNLYKFRNELQKAEDYYREALKFNIELDRKKGMAIAYGNLGSVYLTRGDLGKACTHWGKALALYREIGIEDEAEAVQSWMKEAGCPENAKQ